MKNHLRLIWVLLALSFSGLTAICGMVKPPSNQMKKAGNSFPVYGQVIDQNKIPIPGVKIKVTIQHWQMETAKAKLTHRSPKTDSTGRFELTCVLGDTIKIESMEKKGFTAGPITGLSFKAIRGTADHPMLLKMSRVVLRQGK